jgi:hypothetical protein
MKIPRDLSGHELVAALCRHWVYIKSTATSSCKLGSQRRTVSQFPPIRRSESARSTPFFARFPLTKAWTARASSILCSLYLDARVAELD